MNTIKKFTTFEELKSSGNKTSKHSSKLKKHKNFEKVIAEIRSIQASKNSKKTKS